MHESGHTSKWHSLFFSIGRFVRLLASGAPPPALDLVIGAREKREEKCTTARATKKRKTCTRKKPTATRAQARQRRKRTATMAAMASATPTMGDAGPTVAWPKLPPELWREVLLHCLSDRDLYACLCAARCFHVLTPTDLEARFYADATVEGMCAAGDLIGLEYAARHQPASLPPIDWVACLYDAALLDRDEIIQCILRRPDCHIDVAEGWEQARAVVAETGNSMLRALAALGILVAPIVASDDVTDRMRVRDAMRRMDAVWTHASPDAKTRSVERCWHLGGAWANLVMRFVIQSDIHSRLHCVGAVKCLNQCTEPQQAHVTVGDRVGVRCVADQTATSGLSAVYKLVSEDRLDEAVGLVVDPRGAETPLPCDMSDATVCIVRASARAGRPDLLDALGCFEADRVGGAAAVAQEGGQNVRTVAFCEAATAGHVHILERLAVASPDLEASIRQVHPHILATAVVGGHADCARWLCERAFPAATAEAWCPSRGRYASALSLALAGRRTDVATVIFDAVDGEAAAHRAFDEAVSAGDLRAARYIRAVRSSLALRPAAARKSCLKDRTARMVLIPIDHD
ncbi:hypothetical protein psal_cds_1134 [Pandoravirus salinus]|uniref:Ankyrin repeat domain containing protein n=1 Tax=Pandoravirus salinus TaxID=1349410 RepID=A0A291ATY3_9VIRU|nr:hypothetical protein psal_cds_1134 [Pandoravirus salinus]ATE82285.1 hypothetical protein psal_cds_1134 [Pandoravirus salinus]